MLDRLEAIRIPGYTEDEKVNIANSYLIPKQTKDSGLKDKEWNLEKDVLKNIIRDYTKADKIRNELKRKMGIIDTLFIRDPLLIERTTSKSFVCPKTV